MQGGGGDAQLETRRFTEQEGIKDVNKTTTTLQSLAVGFILAYATEMFPNRIVQSRSQTYACYLATPFSKTTGSLHVENLRPSVRTK